GPARRVLDQRRRTLRPHARPRRRLPRPDGPHHGGARAMKSNSAVMLRRNFKHIARNPMTVFNAVLMPVVVMLMFVYMLGDAFSVGVDYVDYATPGLMLLAV